jgi:hypothetical protein
LVLVVGGRVSVEGRTGGKSSASKRTARYEKGEGEEGSACTKDDSIAILVKQ